MHWGRCASGLTGRIASLSASILSGGNGARSWRMWCLKKITLPRRSCAISDNSASPGLSSSFIAQRSDLATKRERARCRLALDLELQATRHALFIGNASKRIRFKTLAVQPFPDAGHDCRQLLALAAQLNH